MSLRVGKMKRYRNTRILKGMSTIEYFVLIAIVVVSIVGMEFCFKRALSARWKDTGDVFGFGRVYEHP